MFPAVHALSYSFLSPPMLFIVTAVLGIAAAARGQRFGFVIAFASLACFYALATPLLSDGLIAALLRQVPAGQVGNEPAAAIIVLGADEHASADRPADDRLGALSLERVFLAAREYRASHLPILVSGGSFAPDHASLADLMAQMLEADFGVLVRWRETRSGNTYENAEFSAAILHANGISTVVLVSQRWDMPRAIWAFRQFGITAIPSGVVPSFVPTKVEWHAFLPSIGNLEESFVALHELVGLLYYRVVYR